MSATGHNGFQGESVAYPPPVPPPDSPAAKPAPIADSMPGVPEELKQLEQWVVWKYEPRNGKRAKTPYDPRSHSRSDATDLSKWASYDQAAAVVSRYDGLGLVVAPPYVVIDLDNCRDPQIGETEAWAQAIITELSSYTELSPSGKGFHIWVRATLPKGQRRAGRVEMYSEKRYLTITGKRLTEFSENIESRDLSSLHSRLTTLDPALKKRPQSVKSADTVASKFDRLMAGEWEGRYDSPSEADLALCSILARKHNCDPQEIDRAFRRSGLYRPKWEERQDYRDRTIQKAIEQISCPDNGQHESQEARDGSGGSPPVVEIIDWRPTFKSYDQMEQGELEFLVSDFLPHGVTFIGGLPGAGKTWFALSLAKALVTGQPFLGHYAVPAPVPVLYLIPEVGERAFRSRLETIRLTKAGDRFLCRTMKDGFHSLNQSELLAAVKALEPVVVLDSAIRFSTADDENSATDNRQLSNSIFGLLFAGAKGVLGLHHATKASKNEKLDLENALRGTGDLGAICDAAWGLQCLDEASLTISVQCIKARDFEMPPQFKIMGRPYIGSKGDFVRVETLHAEQLDAQTIAFDEFIRKDPSVDYRAIHRVLGFPTKQIKAIADRAGWVKGKKMGKWERTQQSTIWG